MSKTELSNTSAQNVGNGYIHVQLPKDDYPALLLHLPQLHEAKKKKYTLSGHKGENIEVKVKEGQLKIRFASDDQTYYLRLPPTSFLNTDESK